MSTQLFGSNAAWLALGLLAVQTYTYSTCSSKDRPLFKALVYGSVFIAMSESVVEGFVSYSFLVSGWGNPTILADSSSGASHVLGTLKPLFDVLPALFVQFFFTWNIWTFCRATFRGTAKVLIAELCVCIAVMSVCAFIAVAIFTGLTLAPAPLNASISEGLLLVWAISTAVADVTITSCTLAILYHANSHSYFGDTRSRASRIIRITAQTGLLTSILAIPIAPLYAHFRASGVYGLMSFLLGKSYVIWLLAHLNTRTDRPVSEITNGSLYDSEARFSIMDFTSGQKPSYTTEVQGGLSRTDVPSHIHTIVHPTRDDFGKSPTEVTSPIIRETAFYEPTWPPPGLIRARAF